MAQFFVNGTAVTVETNQKLLTYLRDGLHLTGTKNGCSEGACGTCMVLVDGKATKSCVVNTDKLEGKHIITIEGLTEREKDVYGKAFASCGAVQCGFCTPGMIISAKGLLDRTLTPTREEIKTALKGNICRCTGYVKIEAAILYAADLLRESAAPKADTNTGKMGERLTRVDAVAKALGVSRYADDLYLDNMVYASCVRSQYPRARVLAIHTERASALPGVLKVITAADIPGKVRMGHIVKDYPALIPVGETTHFLGDAIALVVGETIDVVEAAKKLIEVEYEVLPAVFSIADAQKEDAPAVHEGRDNLLAHEHLVRGHATERIASSKHVVTNRYVVPFTEHAFLEPECAVAEPTDTGVHIYSGDQGIYQTQTECAELLGLDAEQVRVTAMMVGGGFGGKEDMSVQHHAALAAYLTKRPVKVRLTRKESLLIHPKRHPMELIFTTACDETGRLTAMKATLLSDTGAYASLGGPVLQRACTHAAGPYNYQDIDIEGLAYYTNNPPAGAFRGFGVTQSCFATECNLNQLAELVGMTPYEFRLKNAIRPGDVLPNGQLADETTALVETLEAVRPIMERNPKAGIACAMKNSGLGVGIPDTGRCRITVLDGKLHIRSSAACIGQGMGTVLTQLVCSATGFGTEQVLYDVPDTDIAPNSGNTTASRQTLFTGEAAVRASKSFLDSYHAAGCSIEALEGQSFYGEYVGITDKIGSTKENPVSHIAYGYATHVVELDEDGRLSTVTAVHDVGRAVNPTAIEGQIEGGVTMSLGYALTEDFPVQEGQPTKRFGTLGLFRADQTPEIHAVYLGKASAEGLAMGAKGIGEICSIPTAPAVQNAYYNRDGIFRTELPLRNTPYRKN